MLPDDITRYRERLASSDVDERRAVSQSLRLLANSQHDAFLQLCYLLLDDTEPQVCNSILWHLYQFGDQDDTIAEKKALTALRIPALRGSAMLALGTVGTTAAYAALLECVEAGEVLALRSLACQARTEAQRRQALTLSREWLLSPVYRQRDEALQALRVLSTAEAEEDLLLIAYARYGDELVIWALVGASARMLPVLKDLLTRWPPECVEYHEVERAIRRLESQLAHGESADPALRSLSEYL